MLSLVVICHESQRQNLSRILPACASQDCDCKVLVFEHTCMTQPEDIVNLAHSYGFTTVFQHHDPSGFYAGRNRDAGISHVLATYGPSDFVFIDGDCIPSPDFSLHHRSVLSKEFPVISCGYRINMKHDETLQGDRRYLGIMAARRLFIANTDRLIFNIQDIKNHNVCWSCNLGINYEALLRIQKANTVLVPSETTRVFCSVFDSQWGGEDTLCGIAAFRTCSAIVMLDPLRSHVTHIEHPTKHQNLSNLKRCHNYEVMMSQGLPETSIISGIGLDTMLPDSLVFYNTLASSPKEDIWASFLTDSMKSDNGLLFQYMFARNPKVTGSLARTTQVYTQATILQIYEDARNHVIDITELPKDFKC